MKRRSRIALLGRHMKEAEERPLACLQVSRVQGNIWTMNHCERDQKWHRIDMRKALPQNHRPPNKAILIMQGVNALISQRRKTSIDLAGHPNRYGLMHIT